MNRRGSYTQFSPYSEPPYVVAQREKKEIKLFSCVAGFCVIGYVLMQYLIAYGIYSIGLYNIQSADLENCISILMSVFGVFFPFVLGAIYIKNRRGVNIFRFSRPKSAWLMGLAVPMGLAACMLGNAVTNIFVTRLENIGIFLTSYDYDVPAKPFGRVVFIVLISVVPALTEELAIRGTVMQPLRKYGDTFAILASSAVFALMHGNLVQAPFAFIAGIAIGYAVCITGTLWTGIFIHFFNNLYSVAVSFMIEDIKNEALLNSIYMLTIFLIYAVGSICAIMFFATKKDARLRYSITCLPANKKAAAFILTPPMIIAIIIMLSYTADYVEFHG